LRILQTTKEEICLYCKWQKS